MKWFCILILAIVLGCSAFLIAGSGANDGLNYGIIATAGFGLAVCFHEDPSKPIWTWAPFLLALVVLPLSIARPAIHIYRNAVGGIHEMYFEMEAAFLHETLLEWTKENDGVLPETWKEFQDPPAFRDEFIKGSDFEYAPGFELVLQGDIEQFSADTAILKSNRVDWITTGSGHYEVTVGGTIRFVPSED